MSARMNDGRAARPAPCASPGRLPLHHVAPCTSPLAPRPLRLAGRLLPAHVLQVVIIFAAPLRPPIRHYSDLPPPPNPARRRGVGQVGKAAILNFKCVR